MSKHCNCNCIYFRCKTTVLVFTLSVTVMLLTNLSSASDNKNIGIEYCQKKSVKEYRRYQYRYCIWKVSPILAPILKSIVDTIGTNTNTAILTTAKCTSTGRAGSNANNSVMSSDYMTWKCSDLKCIQKPGVGLV